MSGIFKLILRAVVELFRSRASLEAEILTLRHQINVLRRNSAKRPAFTNIDRLVFTALYRVVPRVVNSLVIVEPETVIGWHRAGFRLFWRWKSGCRRGRPSIAVNLRSRAGRPRSPELLWSKVLTIVSKKITSRKIMFWPDSQGKIKKPLLWH